jgi:ribosomal subunit interface protein
MQTPLQITFHNVDRSEAVEAAVRDRVQRLEKFCDDIIGCRVTVEAPHKHHHQGNRYHVRVSLAVPNADLVTSHEPAEHHAYTDVYVATRDAFDSMQRQLEEYMRRRRGDVKAHATPPHGRIVELNNAEGYGRIESHDGRLIYFHRNSVVGADFDRLQPGAEVRFDEEAGDRGPQASTVHVVGKHHLVA